MPSPTRRRRGVARTFLLGLGLTLAWALPAYAYDYAGTTTLSDAGADVESVPSVALNDAGQGVASWYVELPGTSAVRVATHEPGGAWQTFATPLNAGIAGSACNAFSSLDPSGNSLVVWAQWSGSDCGLGTQTILFATHAAGAPAWSAANAIGVPAPGNLESTMHASSNALGQMVVGYGTTDGTQDYVFGAAGSPTGGFESPVTLTTAAHQIAVTDLTTAIGDGGDAAVQWVLADSGSSNVKISVRQAGQNWHANAASSITTVSSPMFGSSGAVAIDAVGNVLSTFIYDDGASKTFSSRYRPVGGGFLTRQTIAFPESGFGPTPTPGYSGSSVVPGFDGAGNATVVWVESSLTAGNPRVRQLWTARRPAGNLSAWQDSQPLTDAVGSNNTSPNLDVSSAGAAIVSWGGKTAQDDTFAVYRDADGSFFPARDLGQGYSGRVDIAPGGDALIGAIGSLGGGALVTVLDTQAPVITAMNVPATSAIGAPVAMSAAVSDLWTGVAPGQPVWDFGDGASGAGLSISHAFAAAGTYTVTLATTDGAGNVGTPVAREITVAAATAGATGGAAGAAGGSKAGGAGAAGGAASARFRWSRFKAVAPPRYVASRLVAAYVYRGTSQVAGKLTFSVKKRSGARLVLTKTFGVKPGNWSVRLTLPGILAPGDYDVSIAGPGGTVPALFITIAPPKGGIADRVYASGLRRGPSVSKLAGSSELWAHFHLATLPKKGQAITTQWTLPNGTKLAANTRPSASLVEAQVKDLKGGKLPTGLWHCVLRAGGAVVATLNVRLT